MIHFQGKKILIFKAFMVILKTESLEMALRKILKKWLINFKTVKRINLNLIKFYRKNLIKNFSINFKIYLPIKMNRFNNSQTNF